jgi:transforming growth factor-beta-induced protein
MKKHALFLGLLLAFIPACGDSDDDDDSQAAPAQVSENVIGTALGDPRFSTLADALERADLITTLENEGPFTIFAPTNDAFEAAGIDVNAVPVDQLREILLYHVVEGEFASTELTNGPVETAQGDVVLVKVANGAVAVNSARVIEADIQATNGIIHAVDTVLTPPTGTVLEVLRTRPDFSALVGLLEIAGLESALDVEGPITVFAPTNEAIIAVQSTAAGLTNEQIRDVVLYHVLGQRVFSTELTDGPVPTLLEGAEVTIDAEAPRVNDAGLVEELLDIQAINGVIHGVDAVLVPPGLVQQ